MPSIRSRLCPSQFFPVLALLQLPRHRDAFTINLLKDHFYSPFGHQLLCSLQPRDYVSTSRFHLIASPPLSPFTDSFHCKGKHTKTLSNAYRHGHKHICRSASSCIIRWSFLRQPLGRHILVLLCKWRQSQISMPTHTYTHTFTHVHATLSGPTKECTLSAQLRLPSVRAHSLPPSTGCDE
ncbi:unnamed protein product [Protopolystoma xenopodis]|uniref:Uncharacterized protein n=1 Tax=Protopolystoma xenopodis TaxID=117903 RepID=A0A3S5C759_9PLAT|nr:unnamed protein product [Protopolystoma xenopodis]